MRIIIAGGGTAGHINPGLAVAKYIKIQRPEAEILFIGTQRGMETKLVPREGFKLKLIRVRGLKRKISLENIVVLKELFQGIFEARNIIKNFKPDVVFGTGGYVCGPVLLCAWIMRIPTVIHEQNAFPGITNRLLSRVVDIVAISFEQSGKYFRQSKKLVNTGNPIRMDMLKINRKEARNKRGIKEDGKCVVVFGGSLGAKKINEAVVEMLTRHYKINDFNIIFATGNTQYQNISDKLEGLKLSSVSVVPYIYDMGNVMACADLAICRAGAITVSELAAVGVPSILIPSPNVTANHQEYNARALESQGASIVILEKDLNGQVIYKKIKDLFAGNKQLEEMRRNSKKTGSTNAVQNIYSVLLKVLSKNI